MFTKQCVVTLDLEGVLAPEIWIAVAEKTGIKDLRLTTRDIPDYDVLMKGRIKILEREGIKLSDIQNVIANLGLLDGARDFMDTLRDEAQVIILSDTFQEFAYPIMKNLGFPTIFCHNLEVENDMIKGYHLRLNDQKTKVVKHLQVVAENRRESEILHDGVGEFLERVRKNNHLGLVAELVHKGAGAVQKSEVCNHVLDV